MGKEYLVEGALLKCSQGSKVTLLKLAGHGYNSKGREKANVLDCKAGKNVPCFGRCGKNKETHQCEGYMKLEAKWRSRRISATKLEKVNGQDALTMDSVLLCRRGGFIRPITSGQEDLRGLLMLALLKLLRSLLGKWGCCIFGWDPINLNTGNFIYEKEDLRTGGITKLSFGLFYNAIEEGKGGCLGQGWHHNQETHIRAGDKGMLYLCLGDGREIPYQKGIGNLYSPLLGNEGLLWQEEGGYRYQTGSGEEYAFDPKGLLQSKCDPRGNRDTYFYNEKEQLIRVKGANGGELFYEYNEEGRLIRVKDHTGREVQLWYRYGKLCKYVNACGHAYTYAYNANGRLESVLTPRGILGVKNTYDGINRVVKQEMPDGGILTMEYDDENRRTYVTEPGGSRVIYESDERYRNIRTIYEDGEERYAYNDRNQRTLFVDKLGNKTRYRYDEKGNLTEVVNALGEKTSFVYDEESRLLQVETAGRVVRSHSYDEKGRLASIRDALGRSWEAVYDERGLLKEVVQADGSWIRFFRDERGNVTESINPYGEKTGYSYDALNRLIEVRDGEGNTTAYTYDGADRILTITNPEGNTRTFRYNESGKVVEMQDFDGESISYSYNERGKIKTLTDKAGRQWKRSYDRQGNLAEETAPTGVVYTLQYDAHNRLVRREERDAEGTARVVEYSYDPVGNLLEVRAGDGKEILRKETYAYDALNRITAVTSQTGDTTHYEYSPLNGKVERIRDAKGNVRQFFYNEAGELTKEEDSFGHEIHYSYTLLGKLSHKTDPAGRRTSYTYLPGGRLTRIETSTGKETVLSYDGLGRVKERKDKHRGKTAYTYDGMGRVVGVTGPGEKGSFYAYDALGQVVCVTDGKGNRTTYAYTLTGKLKEVVDALGNPTTYSYDERDFLTRICRKGEKEERIMEYTCNGFGEVSCIRDALGHREQYAYDGLGRLVEKVDQEGFVTRYAYTPSGQVEHILYGDGKEVSYAYDALGYLEGMKDWLGETSIERNAQGRPVRITDHRGNRVGYEWGEKGEQKAVVYPDGTTIRWAYDELLRPIRWVRSAQGKADIRVDYGYDEAGRLAIKKSSGGYLTRWAYGAYGELVSLTHEDGQGVLEEYHYAYDELGNKTGIRKKRAGLPLESGEYGYTYDGLQRLTQVTKDGQLLRDYTYDAFGNRIRMEDKERGRVTAYHYNAMDQLMAEEIRPLSAGESMPGSGQEEALLFEGESLFHCYSYDQRGNLVQESRYLGNHQGNDGQEMGQEGQEAKLLHGYAYDARNRMERAWNGKGEEAAYLYNGMGQRVGKATGTSREEYLLDLTKPYHNLLGIRREGETEHFYWDYVAIATEGKGSSPRYYLQDELGSPLRIQYATGKGECYGYDEFGQDLAEGKIPGLKQEAAEGYTRQGTSQPFGYTGYRYDGISGSYFAQAREYQAHTGRFMAEDVVRGKMGVPKTLNRYGYCLGNPLMYVDLNGRWPEWVENAVETANKSIGEIKAEVSNFLMKQVEWVEKEFSDLHGTISVKLTANGNAGMGIAGDIGISIDFKGNVSLQAGYAVPSIDDTVSVGVLDVGIGIGVAITDAQTIDGLLGPSSSVGASGGAIWSIGGDIISFEDMSDMGGDIDGFQITGGVGWGVDIHMIESYTQELNRWNIFEVIKENLKEFGKQEGCE